MGARSPLPQYGALIHRVRTHSLLRVQDTSASEKNKIGARDETLCNMIGLQRHESVLKIVELAVSRAYGFFLLIIVIYLSTQVKFFS